MDLVVTKLALRLTIPEDHTCRSCSKYVKNNNRHGRCLVFKIDTCAEASCRKYKYYKENRKL